MPDREVAERAGVDLDYVTKLVGGGVRAPSADGSFTEGDVRRTRLAAKVSNGRGCRSRRCVRRSTRESFRSGGSTTRSTT